MIAERDQTFQQARNPEQFQTKETEEQLLKYDFDRMISLIWHFLL